MTLKEAQKKFEDAIELNVKHDSYAMTNENVKSFADNIFGKDCPSKVMYSEIEKNSSTIIVSRMAYLEDMRQLSMIPGTKVIMTGDEGTFPEYKDKVWDVIHGPQWMCGNNVVWLEGFSGAYSCDYLKIV